MGGPWTTLSSKGLSLHHVAFYEKNITEKEILLSLELKLNMSRANYFLLSHGPPNLMADYGSSLSKAIGLHGPVFYLLSLLH